MDLKQAHLISSVQTVLGNDERLIYFFFNHKEPEMRAPAAELLDEARTLSHGEYLLVQTAIDFWNGQGGLKLSEALDVLDDENILSFIRGILCLREIDPCEICEG